MKRVVTGWITDAEWLDLSGYRPARGLSWKQEDKYQPLGF